MNARELTLVTAGAILFGYLLIGAFFWSFWARTRERLFMFFCLAFWLLALERLFLIGSGEEAARHPLIYITRLLAFLVILTGIWDRNRQGPPR